jgi:hypothetical protein
MNDKTYLLSFLMMDIYNNCVLKGSPQLVVREHLETAMDFVEHAEQLMKKRGWIESTETIHAIRPDVKPLPGLRSYVISESPEPEADATGTA